MSTKSSVWLFTITFENDGEWKKEYTFHVYRDMCNDRFYLEIGNFITAFPRIFIPKEYLPIRK